MTAVALVYTDSGFAIAADGRCTWSDESPEGETMRKHDTDTQQKIFKASWTGADIAYLLTGMVANFNRSFDLVAETRQALGSVSDLPFGIGIEEFAARLNDACRNAKNDSRLPKYPVTPHFADKIEQCTIGNVVLAGYFRAGKPALVRVRLHHDNQTLAEPQLSVYTPPEPRLFSGSDKIRERLAGGSDARFGRYFHPIDRQSSLEDAIACATGYVSACCDPFAVEVDPLCKYIGGRVHAATITPSGFDWVPGFEPLSPTSPPQASDLAASS